MPFSQSQFRSSFKLGEPASPANFEMTFASHPTFSDSLVTNLLSAATRATFLCRINQAELPGRAFQTTEYSQDHSPTRKFAYGSVYTPMTISVICTDPLWIERRFFTEWMKFISNDANQNDLLSGSNGQSYFEYYSNYVGRALISTYSRAPADQGFASAVVGTNVLTNTIPPTPTNIIALEECYPTAVSPVQLSWEDNNRIATVNIELSYKHWTELSIT